MDSVDILLSRYFFFRRILVRGDTSNSGLESVQQDINELLDSEREDDKLILLDYFATIFRFSKYSPVAEVREVFTEIVKSIETRFAASSLRPVTIGPSQFIPEEVLVPIDSDDSDISKVFQDSFYKYGRVIHLDRIIASHKPYFERYMETMRVVMEDDGPLPLSWRNYLAIMASSQHGCGYLVSLHQQQFLLNGGDANWLIGLEYAPEKLEKLAQLNMLLAHRPWLVTKEHIRELRSQHGDAWSVTELVHAIMILCIYHSLACLSWGFGCAPEIDLPVFLQLNAEVISSDESELSAEDIASIDRDEDVLKERLVEYTADHSVDYAQLAFVNENGIDEETFESAGASTILSPTSRMKCKQNFMRYCGRFTMEYEDFNVKSKEYRVLHASEYSWEDHCFPMIQRYFPRLAPLLDTQFSLIFSLTYNSFGDDIEEIDTTPYRRAIWYYVHRLEGISHDDYNYAEVNVFLNRPTKCYVKKATCFPNTIRKSDYEHFDHNLTNSEKIHVNLLVTEARKQAGLLYGLQAVMKHML